MVPNNDKRRWLASWTIRLWLVLAAIIHPHLFHGFSFDDSMTRRFSRRSSLVKRITTAPTTRCYDYDADKRQGFAKNTFLKSSSSTLATTTVTEASNTKGSFDNFDYLAHWYPVIWACDLPLDQPTKVTIFDTDYVVARISQKKISKNNNKKNSNYYDNDQVIAMLDQCPHKSAALSEGRITARGFIQCAYHGWSYNGTTGQCVDIPQIATGPTTTSSTTKTTNDVSSSAAALSRVCGTAVPAMIQQGLVYLFPGGTLERALLATPPPLIPEMDQPEFKSSRQICDMPLDWPLLLENILDPDHGLFVHSLSSFDWYTASRDVPLAVQETFPNEGKGWTMTTTVDAVEKVLAVDKHRRGLATSSKKVKQAPTANNNNNNTSILAATTLFHAPTFALTGRRSKSTGETTNLIGFWVCPVGTGRSRLLTAFTAKSPVAVPRWLTSLLFNNFLDQDTFLLVTQHQHVLQREADSIKQVFQDDDKGGNAKTIPNTFNSKVRKSLYQYRSPTERASARVGNFWDTTLHRAPNRIASLLAMERRGELRTTPSREEVLDRDKYHLQVCPDSQAVVKNCRNIRNTASIFSVAVIALRAYASLGMALSSSGVSATSWWVQRMYRIPNAPLGGVLALAALTSYLAEAIRREYYFKYDRKQHLQDLEKIPKKVWLD